MKEKKLLRSRSDRMWLGVAGGVAEYLGVDPVLVRFAFVMATLFGNGLGLLAYVVLAIVIPESPVAEKSDVAG